MAEMGKRLHPAAFVARWVKMAPELFVAGIGLSFTASERGLQRFVVFALLALAVGGGIALAQWLRFRYRVGAGEIVIEQGLFQRRRRVIPFDRVQDISIERPLLARLFGTARVRIETGAAAKDEGELAMVSLADAQGLRDRVRHGGREAGAETAVPPLEPVLFAMGLGRVLLAGLFGFSLVFLIVIATAAQQLDQYGLVNWEDWFTQERFEAASHMVTVQVVLVLAALIVIAGLMAGVVQSLLRDFGFRLTRTDKGLRRRRGLLTLSEVVIPIRRAQAAVIESGPVGRVFGWYRLSFQTLGADRKEGGTQVAAPFARLAEILPILAEAGFPAPPDAVAFQRGARRGLARRLPPWFLLAAAATAAAILVDWRFWFVAALFLLCVGWAAGSWRAHRHAEDLEALYVTRGLLKRRLSIMPYDKLQILSVSAGPLQRPLGLASLGVDTAGAPAMRGIRLVDLDASAAGLAAKRLYAAFLGARTRLKAASG